MKRALLILRDRIWLVLLALSIGLLMVHQKALIDDGEEIMAEVVADTLAEATRTPLLEAAP